MDTISYREILKIFCRSHGQRAKDRPNHFYFLCFHFLLTIYIFLEKTLGKVLKSAPLKSKNLNVALKNLIFLQILLLCHLEISLLHSGIVITKVQLYQCRITENCTVSISTLVLIHGTRITNNTRQQLITTIGKPFAKIHWSQPVFILNLEKFSNSRAVHDYHHHNAVAQYSGLLLPRASLAPQYGKDAWTPSHTTRLHESAHAHSHSHFESSYSAYPSMSGEFLSHFP